MNPPESRPSKLSPTAWLVLTIASIGFLFDTYELLMTPLVAAPAIAELLKIPLNNPIVTDWVGRLLWISALCGGVFGLLGGWLVDKLGRKRVMALSIFLYSLSPFCAAAAVCARVQGLEGKTRRWHTQAAQLCPAVRAGIAPHHARDRGVVGVRLWHRLWSLASNGRPRNAGFARVEATGRRTRTAA